MNNEAESISKAFERTFSRKCEIDTVDYVLKQLRRRKTHYVIGSRSSELAMIQTRHVRDLLEKRFPTYTFSIESKLAHGDKVLDKPLAVLAGATPGLFTKDLEVGLASRRYDLIVHSLKDMPTTLPDGLMLASVTKRVEPEDALLVCEKHRGCKGLESLPKGAVVGTSSVRRVALIRERFPHLICKDVRGNLQTRLRKLHDKDGKYDALILAVAGLKRLGWDEHIESVLSWMPYGVGQGALGIECREDDENVKEMLRVATQDLKSAMRCLAERGLMRTLNGGCQVPIAVRSSYDEDTCTVRLQGDVLSDDGKVHIQSSMSRTCRTLKDATEMGHDLGKVLLDKGARKVLGLGGADTRAITYSDAATG